jgi:uncharacterized membrane protein YkvA (DUF1232 family)
MHFRGTGTPLDTSQIESMINDCCTDTQDDPDLHELLATVADRHGVSARKEDVAQGAQFVLGYIQQVPYMMKIAWTAATAVGLQKEMQHILETVESYWMEGDDIIPDDLGVIGLMDDAYCSLSSLQAVSDHYQLQSGKFLFPDDLSAANKAMRKIIGEPYASDLDRIVINALQETGLIEAVKSFASEEKQSHFSSNSNIWNHGPAGNMEIAELAGLGLLDES